MTGESDEMKIYGDYTFLLDKLKVWNNSQVKVFQNGTKVVEFADHFLEQQRAASKDEFCISKEGQDYMRDQMSDLSASDESTVQPDGSIIRLAGDGLSLMDGLCRTYILQRLDCPGEDGVSARMYNEMAGKYKEKMAVYGDSELSSHAQSLAEAHLAMRDKIIEGYANGTREMWVVDNSTGDDFSGVEFEIGGRTVRYRKVTVEEELRTVEKTFEELVDNVSMKIAKERMQKRQEAEKAEAEKNWTGILEDGEEDDENSKAFWDLSKSASNILEELKDLIKKIEEEKMKEKQAKEATLGDRLAAEQAAYRTGVAARGKQQAQYANYRKISQMTADAQTVMGIIKA